MIKIGSRVKYVRLDTFDDMETGFYPPIGTCGTIVDIGERLNIRVKWDSGTKDNGIWWCETTDVEEAEMNEVEILVQKLIETEDCIEISFDDICIVAKAVINLGYARKEVN